MIDYQNKMETNSLIFKESEWLSGHDTWYSDWKIVGSIPGQFACHTIFCFEAMKKAKKKEKKMPGFEPATFEFISCFRDSNHSTTTT